jgi:phytoene dehydrogenase-like protein
VEVVDFTTPVTSERYTNNFHGFQPWGHPTEGERVVRKGLSITLPGLRNFYMVGHWAAGMIGVNTVGLMGRNLAKQICRKEGKSFVTSVPE